MTQKLTMRCLKCEKEETIDLLKLMGDVEIGEDADTEEIFAVSKEITFQKIIKDMGWEILKICGGEGYCCKDCINIGDVDV